MEVALFCSMATTVARVCDTHSYVAEWRLETRPLGSPSETVWKASVDLVRAAQLSSDRGGRRRRGDRRDALELLDEHLVAEGSEVVARIPDRAHRVSRAPGEW